MNTSEKIELLGKGLYVGTEIPDILTLKSLPTTTELDYVGAEDFDATMLDKILPSAVEEKINFHQLLEIDYYWICRCLRFLNYGPYYTAPAIFCPDCRSTSTGDYRVDLRSVTCNALPQGFSNDIVISADEFIDFDQDVHLKLLTIQEALNTEKDKMFQDGSGKQNRDLARICYNIKAIGTNDKVTPIEVKSIIQNKLSPADYVILKNRVHELTNYGLVASGTCTCPKCGSKNASFLALVDDRFFRPTLGDIKEWKRNRSQRSNEDDGRIKANAVRKDN